MKEVAIKDICEKGSSALKQKELLSEGKYPVYGASGIAGYLDSYQQENEYIGIVKDGSGIGRVAFYPEKTSLIGTMQYILPKKGYNIRYIGYCLQSLDLSKYKQGAAIPHIYFSDYGERVVKVTSDVQEQNTIVERLDVAFTKIDALRNNAEKQLAEARALFYRALSEKLLPKEGWNKYTIADICKSATYGTSSPSNDNGRYKYLRMNNINTDGSLNLNNLKTIDIPDKELEKYLVRKGDLLFNRTNSPELVGKSCVFDREEEMIIAGYIIRIRIKDGFDPYFVCYFINLQRQIGNLKPLIVGAVHQANISATAIKSLEIHCPPLAVQKLIVSQLDVLSVNVRKMEDILHKTQTECDAVKQAMLKKVFE